MHLSVSFKIVLYQNVPSGSFKPNPALSETTIKLPRNIIIKISSIDSIYYFLGSSVQHVIYNNRIIVSSVYKSD